MFVTTAIGILQRKPVIMRCSPADQRRQTDKGDHNKTFAGALLLLQLHPINCRLSVVLSSTTYAQSFKYPPYLAQIKTTPLKESSVDHAALCGVWRRHMVVLHTHTSQHIGYHHMRCARFRISVCQHSKYQDSRQHILLEEWVPQWKKLNFMGQCFVGMERGHNKVVRTQAFTQLWAHAMHIDLDSQEALQRWNQEDKYGSSFKLHSSTIASFEMKLS